MKKLNNFISTSFKHKFKHKKSLPNAILHSDIFYNLAKPYISYSHNVQPPNNNDLLFKVAKIRSFQLQNNYLLHVSLLVSWKAKPTKRLFNNFTGLTLSLLHDHRETISFLCNNDNTIKL